MVHVNTLYGSLNYSSFSKGKRIQHTHREDHQTFEKFISEAGFNLIYIFPEGGSEPENKKPDSLTSV